MFVCSIYCAFRRRLLTRPASTSTSSSASTARYASCQIGCPITIKRQNRKLATLPPQPAVLAPTPPLLRCLVLLLIPHWNWPSAAYILLLLIENAMHGLSSPAPCLHPLPSSSRLALAAFCLSFALSRCFSLLSSLRF